MSKSQIATGGIADDAVSTAKVLNDSRIVTPLIINGDMAVAQRGTSATGLGASSGYNTCDRWKLVVEGTPSARFTQSQDTDVPTGQGFTTSLKMDCTTAAGSPDADDALGVQTLLEAQDLQLLRYGTSSAKKVTLSFWVKATKTGTNVVWIYQNDDARSQAQTYTVNSSNTWEKKVVVFAADTTGVIDNNNGEGFRITWWMTTGTDRTSGTLATTWESHSNANNAVGQVNNADSTSNNWYITGVQLEVGEFDSDTIPPFPFESFESNQLKCKRYYQIIGEGSTGWITPAANYNGTYTFGAYRFMPEMRTSPSISVTTGTDYYSFTANSAGDGFNELKGQDFTSMSCQLYSDSGISATSAGHAGNLRVNNSSAKAAVDAEL